MNPYIQWTSVSNVKPRLPASFVGGKMPETEA